MFFSCCDWEDAREAEKHHGPQQVLVNTNECSIGENFSSDEEDLEKPNSIQVPQSSHKMCKRKSKLARKASESVGELDALSIDCSQRSELEHIDIDSVIKKVASVQDTERIVSFKKYFSNRKAQRANKLT